MACYSDDFEVAIFLKDTSTRHSLLTKQKQFSDKPKLKSTGNKLTGWLNTSENPIHIADDDQLADVLHEGDADVVELSNIPEASNNTGTTKRKPLAEDDDDALFVSSSDEEFFQTQRERVAKKRRKRDDELQQAVDLEETNDDKKKMGLETSYDGFSIYGRILCLIVTRRGRKDTSATAPVGGSQMMEQWVSTQVAQENGGVRDDDEG